MRRRHNLGWVIMGLGLPIWMLGMFAFLKGGTETIWIEAQVLAIGGGTMILGVIVLHLIHRARARRPQDEMFHSPYYNAESARQRRDACEHLALSKKIDFQWVDEDLLERLQTPLLRRGKRPTAHCVLKFPLSGDVVTIFDFLYTVTDADDVSTLKSQTVAVIPIAGVPAFQLFPESLDRKLIDRFGGFWAQQDIDFADDPEFSSAFVLRSDQEEATRDLLRQRVRNLLLRDPFQSIEVEGDVLLWCREDIVIRTECLPDLVAKAVELKEALTTRQSIPSVREPPKRSMP